MMIPVNCGKELVRVGGSGDGAYLVPDDLEAIDACFSPGVSNTIGFEVELAEKYGIPSYLCDASSNPDRLPLIPDMHIFMPRWLGSFDSDTTTTLDAWVLGSEHCDAQNLLLQMDIEGAEFNSLLACSTSILSLFRVFVVELHWMERLRSARFLNQVFMPTMHKLGRIFDCVHAHANNCCGSTNLCGVAVPNVIELTYYRKDANSCLYPPQIPHPLDVVNVLSNEPLLLGPPWTGHE